MAHDAATTVLLTGATGFIGTRALAALTATGCPVRAGTRRPRATQLQAGVERVAAVACDLDNPAEVRAAVAGATTVIHTAYADVSAMPRQCQTLLDAMAATGVPNLIYLSSIAVYGERAGVVHEDASPAAPLNSYALAKQQCESLVADWSVSATDGQQAPRRAVIFRPGIVYGTGSRFWIDKLADRIAAGAWGTFGAAGEGRAALIHVDDVATAITTACDRLQSAARLRLPQSVALNLVGPEAPTWNTYFAALARACGSQDLPEIAPGALAWRIPVSFGAKLWRRAGLPGANATALAPTRDEMQLFRRDARYSMEAARAILGLAPSITLAEGLARTQVPQAFRKT